MSLPSDDDNLLSDGELLRLATMGDRQAFSEFCTRTLPTLSRMADMYCRRYALPRDFAQDAVQGALLSALEKIRSQNPSGLNLAYLIRSVHNKIIDEARKRSRTKATSEALETLITDSHTEPIGRPDFYDLLDRYEHLSASERELLESIYLKGLKPAQIAEQTGTTKWSVYKQLERLLNRMRVSKR